jgi:hypothetical protein
VAVLASASVPSVRPTISGSLLYNSASVWVCVCSLSHHFMRQMHDLIKEYSLQVVQAYMTHIMVAAEAAVRAMLCEFSTRSGMNEVRW